MSKTKLPGWTKTGDRYFYNGKRKAADRFEAAKARAATKATKAGGIGLPGWTETNGRYFYKGKRKSFESLQNAIKRWAAKGERVPPKVDLLYGWSSKSEFKRSMRTKQSKRWIEAGEIETDDDTGDPPIYSEYAALYLEAKRSGWDRSAGSPFAYFLEWLGLRDEGADYDVGETDSIESVI